ncbi:hypothetical protein [Clostridium sp. AM58-1XD]|uniref:hypothetical protein n=1 Tax=Clostridium sp. AM58-1XD TaxID=2292307 RepID=UPI000E53D0A7|nr:hypothetical protein [Clostridium sp. AM58-1XD]RGY95011.1 hypothetical protein DXA13_20030 [Clostridium sp. AM58-1XD]
MENEEILEQAVNQARMGLPEGFETVYILTYQEIYQAVLESEQEEDQAEQLLEMVYVTAYNKIKEAPHDGNIVEWLKEILYGLGYGEETNQQEELEYEIVRTLSEEKAATIFLKIEEQVGILPKDELTDGELPESESGDRSFFKIFISVILSAAVVAVVSLGLWKHKSSVPFSAHKRGQERILKEETQRENESEEATEENYTVTVHLADQVFILNEEGKILSSKRENERYHEAIQTSNRFTYYLLKEENIPEIVRGKLIRVYENDPEEYETIDDNVRDYTVQDDYIYYVKDGMIERRDTSVNYGKRKFSYHLNMQEEGFYLANEIGNYPESTVTSIQMNDMEYTLENGYIVSVKEAKCQYDGIIYSLADEDGDGRKELCWQSDGDTGVLVKEGFGIDSFCLAEDWIYYSAFEESDPDSRRYSRIYRIRPDGSAQELITDTFQGNLTHMYYSNENKKIYAEIMPDSFHSYYGRLVSISLNGDIHVLEDESQRAGYQTTGNDMLKFVGAEGNQIYCYWYDCQWVSGDQAEIMWTKPLVLYD